MAAVALVAPQVAVAEEDAPTEDTLYSDLYVALRAEDGTPVLVDYEVTDEDGTTIEYCVQPISYTLIPGIDPVTNPVDGRDVWLVPLQGELVDPPEPLPDEEEVGPCDPQVDYAAYVSEAELERLNLVRTSPETIARKLSEVEAKLTAALVLGLDGAGRITTDGVAIDAGPEHAAMYQELMKTGTLPGLEGHDEVIAGPPAYIDPLDAWMLSGVSIGAAASKAVPITIDTVLYYNRIIPFPPAGWTPPADWPVEFNQSADPNPADGVDVPDELFVDYSNFTYTRSDYFKGSVTWLDIPSLTWFVDRILDVVPFTNLTAMADIDDVELTGVLGYAQWVDDVRAVINYYHDNDVVEGFYFDIIGQDTTDEQKARLLDPDAVNRVGGVDRIETAILLSQERFEADEAGSVVLARSDDYPDALTSVPLTKNVNAPLLLTKYVLDPRVATEIDRVLPDGATVYMIGGPNALALSAENALKAMGYTVERLAGDDRYETAVAVADRVGDPLNILMATGRNFPDALSAGPAAAWAHGVVVLTADGVMPDVTEDYLAAHPDAITYTIGGPASAADPSATPVVGDDRYETAKLVAEEFFEFPMGVSIASGVTFPDAMSGGADAAAQEWPLLLTKPDYLSPDTRTYIAEHPSVVMVDVYGGVAAIADVVIAQIYDALAR